MKKYNFKKTNNGNFDLMIGFFKIGRLFKWKGGWYKYIKKWSFKTQNFTDKQSLVNFLNK